MANAKLFKSQKKSLFTTSLNAAGSPAYALSPKHSLLQMIMTGTLTNTFYTTAETQLGDLLTIANSIVKTDPMFLAKAALYARDRGYMKDSPAVLLAVLASEQSAAARAALKLAFPKVINNGKMLKNFVQMIRSGNFARKSLGAHSIKSLLQKWFENRNANALFRDSIGNDPSLADVIKMAHPKPESDEKASLYAYLIGKPLKGDKKDGNLEVSFNKLPALVREFENWKADRGQEIPDVPFQMLTAQPLTTEQWTTIALNASWTTLRMNLNTFLRHGVFNDQGVVTKLAAKLADETEIQRAKVFPYQLMTTLNNIDGSIPLQIKAALAEAVEIAINNVPSLAGKIAICPDVSGSMGNPVTNGTIASKTRCVDVAALFTAALLRKNASAQVLPFNTAAINATGLSASKTVLENANFLAGLLGGGTDCAAPLKKLNAEKTEVDCVILISDNESNAVLSANSYVGYRQTQALGEWNKLKERNPKAKLICIDITPNKTTQVMNRADVLNVGGFSDNVFDVIFNFLCGKNGASEWINEVEALTF